MNSFCFKSLSKEIKVSPILSVSKVLFPCLVLIWIKYFSLILSVNSEAVPQKAIFPLFKIAILIGKYMDLAQADEEREEREHEIYLEYPEYYENEGILEEEEKWLEEFLNQLPKKKKEHFKQLIEKGQNY